jgi:PAS domain S-box-containing protein
MAEAVRVLIVEDNEDHASLESEFLKLAGSFDVDIAPSLGDLWERLAAESYHVVLLDHNLPDGTGLEALPEVAARGYQVPVVMVTGRGDERVAAQAIQRGAVDYVVKGNDYLRTLPALVHKAIRHHKIMVSAQESLRQIRYQSLLLDNVHDAVVVWDLNGRITFWNHAADELFGSAVSGQVGHPVAAYFAAFSPAVDAAADEAVGNDLERQVRGPESTVIWISSRVTALNDERGQRIGYMDVCRDITARKGLEAQIQATQLQLTQAARLSAIGELASGVAHQISNPLTGVIGEAQILLRELPPDHPARESAEAIERAGWRAQAVVKRLMEFSRPGTGTLGPRSVNETIEHALMLVQAHHRWIGFNLQVELAPNMPPVHGSARQMEDLWINLLLAARDTATGEGARCLCVRSVLDEPATIRVSVRVDGVTLPPERLASMFEPNLLEPVHGLGQGLALAICREIVRQHQGSISATSDAEHGTTFNVLLPAQADGAAEPPTL